MANLALLRVAPLLSATSYVTFTFSEDTLVRPLVRTSTSAAEAKIRRHANRILPSLCAFTRRGLPYIFLSYPISIATAATNLVKAGPGVSFASDASSQARTAAILYSAGLVFSVLHFPLGPTAMSYLDRVGTDQGVEGDLEADNTANMASWLRINAIRGVVADIPSLICYFFAFLYAME
jgi:hypothetical protein